MMDRDKLKRTIEAVEAAETAIKDMSGHKRDIYNGVKDEFDLKVLRKIIARRRMDPDSRKRDDNLLDEYEVALGMVGDAAKAVVAGVATYDEAAETAGVSRRTMARAVARARVPEATEQGTPPHDSETGEVHQPVEEIAAEILALPIEERVAAIMVVEALTTAPAVAAIIKGREPPASIITDDEAVAEMVAARKRLDDMKRAKGLAT
jgi:uncharacterized protein (UPF0335 family)